MPDTPTLSIVAPCFNEAPGLPEFIRRAGTAADRAALDYEMILVDDGSSDATWSRIVAAAASDRRILGIRLRRNHGHQLALSAGLAAARGDLVLLIDADLQDPPELLSEMIERLRAEQADVVYGQRRRRAGETAFKLRSAAAFYWLIGWLSDVDIPPDAGDFRLITRPVVDLLAQMSERNRFLRGMVAWIGGTQVPLLYDRSPRRIGHTKYPLHRMLRLASDAITGFSRRPLQIATATGVLATLFSIGLALYSLVGWLLGVNIPGWTSLMAAVGFLSALQFMMLGIIGEYLGRLYEESRGRPLFLEACRVGHGLSDIGPPRNSA